ncbi:MAG: NHLP family bacteriocin export ABC transporter peptidase/permease/ATPase subunit [Parachlamydiaceae bacterium]
MENSPSRTIQKKKSRRVKTPTVIQMEAVECGAASLGIILGYYGCYVPLEKLRVLCGVTRDGSNALNIIKAGQSLGLEGRGFRKELDQLADLPLPFIAHWGLNHFLVIEGFSDRDVYINDPATGPRKISYREMDANFTGIILSFIPGSSFKKNAKPSLFSSFFFRRMVQSKGALSLIILVSLCIIIVQLSLAAFSQVFLDYLVQGKALDLASYFIWGMCFLFILMALFSSLKEQLLNRLYLKLSILFSTEFFWHIISLPISFFAQRYAGEIAHRMSLNDSVASSLVIVATKGVLNVLLASVFGVVLFCYDTLIASITLAIVLINLSVIYFLYRSRQDAYACYQQVIGKSNAFSIGGLGSIETLKATSSESKFFSRWIGYYTKSLNVLQNMTKIDVISGVLPPFLEAIGTMSVLMVGIWRIMNGDLTVGMLLAITIIVKNFTWPVYSLLGLIQSIQLVKVNAERLEDVLKNPSDPALKIADDSFKNPDAHHPTIKLEGFLDVKNISFGFNPNADPIFEEVSLSLAPGRSVALVGESGSGKSTIAKLIGGFFVPLKGEILFDGLPRAEISRTLMTNSLAIVEQEPSLFSDTIRDNITLMERYPIQEDVIRAAQDACIHDDIMKRKGGYDLMLEANGVNLSGGQRQRLQIARALYRDPTILILDEATSALDSETEAEVIKNIRRRGCACLMVAHRLSTVMNCDEILVLSKGRVVQRGSHAELMKEPGQYKTLVEIEKFKEQVEAGAI